MDRIDQLMSDYFDGELSPVDAQALAEHLETDAAARQLFLELYQQHRLLAADALPAAEPEFTARILAELRQNQETFVRGVMRQIDRPSLAAGVRGPSRPAPQARWTPSPPPARTPVRTWFSWTQPAFWVAFASCLLVGLGLSLLLGIGGEPVRAWVLRADGQVAVTRAGRHLEAHNGLLLRAEDVIRTSGGARSVIKYSGESTQLELEGGTELRLAKTKGGKLLELRQGQVAAAVASQPPGRPLVVVTAQARAIVLGTRFTLAARTASTWLGVNEGSVELRRSSDLRWVRVEQGNFAVAASGLDLASQPLGKDSRPDAPQPVRISFFSEYPENEDWLTTAEAVQQRLPFGPSFHPFKVPPVEGSVVLEGVATLEGLARPADLQAKGWGLGIGLRCTGQERGLTLRTLQAGPQGPLLQFSDLHTTHLPSRPVALDPAGPYHLKVRLDRPPGRAAVWRGKIWGAAELEPEQWMVVHEAECRGPLAAVAVSTLNCAVTFRNLKLFLIE